jgi:hypothetical protein
MSEEHSFACQLLHVWANVSGRGGLMENARIQQLGQRTFIVGSLVTKDGRNGLITWVPIEEVSMLVEYPDKARAEAVMAEGREYHRKKAKRGWWGRRRPD